MQLDIKLPCETSMEGENESNIFFSDILLTVVGNTNFKNVQPITEAIRVSCSLSRSVREP